ncbi:MAG: hypothetical protein HKN83_03990 [Gammaproteobacteria bacterium]|nr:hypothetical protein [Gammaproteobacteria bacterium]
MSLIKDLGALRLVLIAAALLVAFMSPQPGTGVDLEGWGIIPTAVIPASTPLIFMVLMFDFMMCRIRMSDEDVRKKFSNIGYIELATALFLLIMWLPFFLAIGR